MSSHKSIAMLDSGVGGLTVVREISGSCRERIVYFGDTARMPYGPRPMQEVRRFAGEIIEFLYPGYQDGDRGLQLRLRGGASPLSGNL
jgi:glutamate racemase